MMSRTVCVTGGTGFLATELIKQLLEKGFTVRATVRNSCRQDDPATTALSALGEALPGDLVLREADLLNPGDFDDIVEGCSFVFHVASPFGFFDSKNPKHDLLDPAILGTQNVLSSVVKHKSSVKRVILTSSVAAVHGEYEAPPKNGIMYTEDDWNETSSLQNSQPYHLSKVIAEREGWRIAESEGIDLVSICPNFIIGPLLSKRSHGVSISFFKGVLEETMPGKSLIFCDVRDVAKAHILAALNPDAHGRYIISHQCKTSAMTISCTLREHFPQFVFPLPEADADERTVLIDNSKATTDLGQTPEWAHERCARYDADGQLTPRVRMLPDVFYIHALNPMYKKQ